MTVEDISSNGTSLNGKKLERGKPAPLKSGHLLALDTVHFRFEMRMPPRERMG